MTLLVNGKKFEENDYKELKKKNKKLIKNLKVRNLKRRFGLI